VFQKEMLTLEAVRNWLFVGARRPPYVLVYDTGTGKLVSTVEAGRDSHDIFHNCGSGRVLRHHEIVR
jgi:hypothetical protein